MLTEFLGFGGSAKRALEVLEELAGAKTTVAVQIEGTQQRFRSRLLLKDGQVVFAKPESLQQGLHAGKYVRFRIPDDPSKEVRLEVLAPQVNLASGASVFLCKAPTTAPTPAKRQSDRHGLAHLSNVVLVLPQSQREFRLTDISLTGCRVLTTPPEAREFLPIGRDLPGASIQIGSKAKVDLVTLTPRAHRRNSVGAEFTVRSEGTSQVYLERLIQTLERQGQS